MQYEITITVPDELLALVKGLSSASVVAPPPAEPAEPATKTTPEPVAEDAPVTDNPLRPAPDPAMAAKMAVVSWAKINGQPQAVAILADEFGVKLAEISDEQAPAILARFGGAA